MREPRDVDPLSDRAGAKGRVEPVDGSFADDSLTLTQAVGDKEYCRLQEMRQRRDERRLQAEKWQALLGQFVRLH